MTTTEVVYEYTPPFDYDRERLAPSLRFADLFANKDVTWPRLPNLDEFKRDVERLTGLQEAFLLVHSEVPGKRFTATECKLVLQWMADGFSRLQSHNVEFANRRDAAATDFTHARLHFDELIALLHKHNFVKIV